MHLRAHVVRMSGFIQIQRKIMDFEGIFFVCLVVWGLFCLVVWFLGVIFVGFSGIFFLFLNQQDKLETETFGLLKYQLKC